MTHIVYVYGTLRPGLANIVRVPGTLYDLGFCPGAVLYKASDGDDVPLFVAEPVEVTDDQLARLDTYEGYNPDREHSSLYIRKAFRDGWIYEYNYEHTDGQRIMHGDWLRHKKQTRGTSYRLVFKDRIEDDALPWADLNIDQSVPLGSTLDVPYEVVENVEVDEEQSAGESVAFNEE